MNRTDRLLAIVLELQAKRWRRAEDLAATFEVSKRTIYRDLAALGQTGVPVVSLPGRGYSLVEGYFLPPLSFTTDEATMLLLGADVMAQSMDAQYRSAAAAATRKIAAVLPERLRVSVAALKDTIHFIATGGTALRPDQAAKLQQLRRAILDRTTVRFRYHTRYPSDAGSLAAGPALLPRYRDADPYALSHVGGAWYLGAYCHLRRDVRSFRLERIEDLTVLDDRTFERPAGFQLMRRDLFEPGSYDVRVLFDASVARWVRESPSFYTVAEEETPDGLLVTLHIRQESEIMQWLLGWGRHARVLDPPALRTTLASEAAALLALYQETPHVADPAPESVS